MPSILPPAERRSVVLVATYAALSLLLLVVGEHLPTGWLRGGGAFLFEPFDRLVLTGDRLFAAWRENTTLHQRIAELELQNHQLTEASVENRHLREQLGLPMWHALPLKPVEVLALGGDPTPTTATLSAGQRDGVRPGDALMTSLGLIGRVTEVWPRLSRAVLLTDPGLAVSCVVETTGVNGILRFTNAPRPRLLLTAVPLADTIKVGEQVVTSELSVRFPRGIPIGRVMRVTHDASGLLQEVEVQPAAQLSRLRHAFIAPGPQAPGGEELPRPHVEFEPRRIQSPSSAARDSASMARHARAHSDSLAGGPR